MEKCIALLIENGEVFLQKASLARNKIAKLACPWIPNGAVLYISLNLVNYLCFN